MKLLHSMPALAGRLALLAAGISCLLVGTAWGDAIPIVNQGFESPSELNGPAAGWTAFGSFPASAGAGAYNPYEFVTPNWAYSGANPTSDPANSGAGYPGIIGEQLGYTYKPLTVAGLKQVLSSTLEANTTYTLSVETLHRDGTGLTPFAGSEIELFAGSTLIASATDTVGPAAGGFEIQTTSVDSANFSGLVGQSLEVVLATTNTGLVVTDWDNVTLNSGADVPEPSSIWLVAVPAVFVFARRRGRGRPCRTAGALA